MQKKLAYMQILLYLCTLFLTITNKTIKLLINLLTNNNNIMKKIFTVIVASLMIATSVSAQHEIGAIVGGLNGASYKYWFNENMAIQADLAVGLTRGAGAFYYKGDHGANGDFGVYDFTLNPNFLYHFQLPANLKFYTGGGLSIGMLNFLEGGSKYSLMGKFGLNAVAGISYDFDAVPLVLAFDFRPGYGLGFQGNTANSGFYPMHLSYFDWKLGLAVRYKF